MRHSDFDPAYLPSAVPTPAGHIDLMGVAELDSTDLMYPVDYHHPEASTLRFTQEQARHTIRVLTHALACIEGPPRD